MAQYTEFLGVTKLEPGQQQAHVVANEAFDNYDRAVAGLAEIDLAGREVYALSGRESTNAVLRFVNADRACLATMQARPKSWMVMNDGGFEIQIQAEGQTSVPASVPAGGLVQLVCDGRQIRPVGDGAGALENHDHSPSAHGALTANKTFYVRQGGDDGRDGLTAATALATVAAVKDRVRNLKTNGRAVTVDVGAGSWPALAFYEGDWGDATMVIISGAGADQTVFAASSGAAIRLYNLNIYFSLRNLGLGSGDGCGVETLNIKRLDISNVRFNQCGTQHISLQLTHCVLSGTITVTGGGTIFAMCNYSSYLRGSAAITLTNTPKFSQAFSYCANNSVGYWAGTTFSGAGAGRRFRVEYMSCLKTNGGGENFFPGDTAGITDTATGGCYA